jgi:hypothetical protein
MSKRQERQRFIRFYRERTGETEIDMRKVAELAKADMTARIQPARRPVRCPSRQSVPEPPSRSRAGCAARYAESG